MMSDDERQRAIDDYYYSVQNGIPVTKELFESFKDAQTGIKGLTAAQAGLYKALGKAIADTTKAMYQGKQGAEVMADGVETVTTALGALGVALMALGGPLGLLAGAVGVGVIALGKFNKVASKQADELFKTYKDLSSSGQAAAGGMTEIFESMQKFGYGIEQLGDMTALLKENSKALSDFGGTAASGSKAFANAANDIQRSDVGRALQMLGKTPDDINKGIALFVKQQQGFGVSSANINKDLSVQSAAYIRNLDLLSKLTGENAEQLQSKIDEAQAEDAFNQTQYELKRKADAGDLAASKQYQANNEIAMRLTGTALKEFQQGVGGDVSAMSKTFMTASGAVQMLSKGSYTAEEYINALAKGAGQTRDSLGSLAKFNATNDFLLPMKEIGQMQSRYAAETAEQQRERAKAEQELQINGLDPTTKSQVELRLAQMNSRDSLQSFVQAGVAPATEAMKALAGATNTAAGMANKVMPGAKEPAGGKSVGGGSTGGGGMARKALDYGGTAIGGTAGALAVGGATAGIGTVAGAVGGAMIGNKIGTAIADFFGLSQPDQEAAPPETQIKGAGATGSAQTALAYFQSQGWTKEQAAGIVGNLQAESGPGLDTSAVGDGGKAYGIAQWHPPRQKDFEKYFGKPIQQSSLKEQLEFIQWELSNTEIKAGTSLKSAKTAEEAAQIVDRLYERSTGQHLNKRISNATTLAQQKAEFGGIVRAKPGGTNILAGEAGQDEAFVPLARGKIPVDIKNSNFIKEFTKNILGEIKQPGQMDPQSFAKIITSSINDYRSVQPAGGELTQTISPDLKIADNLNSMKSMLDTFVNTKMPSSSDLLNSVMPDFSKMLPINDIATSIADKVNQQTANNNTTAPITPATTTTDNAEQLALMSQQLNKLDELVRVMTSQLDVSGKILAYQQ